MKATRKPVLFPSVTIILYTISCLIIFHITGTTVKGQTSKYSVGSDETNNRVRIVFYNTENLFDTFDDSTTADEEFLPDGLLHWTYGRYMTKLEKVCKVIIAAGEWNPPDIIGLGEIENSRVLLDLIHNTPLVKYAYRYIHQNSPDIRGIDVALLYNPATVKVLERTFIPVRFFNTPEITTRDILYCKISLGLNDSLHLFINHWPSRSGGILETEPLRLYASRILRLKIDSILQTNLHHKIIIAGDFNDEPYDKSLSQGIHAKTEIDSPLPGILYNLSAGYEKTHGVGTHKYQGRWNMLDQIIVSGDLLTAKQGLKTSRECFTVFAAPFLLTEDNNYAGFEPFRTYKGPIYTGGFSDHLPVIIDLY